MNTRTKVESVSQGLRFFSVVLVMFTCYTLTAQTDAHYVRNFVLVLVHGAWADGSGRKNVYGILVKDDLNVSVAQEPETSFQDNVAATRRILALQNGPCILAAHIYGAAVITEAGTDPSVAGFLYVVDHMPYAGDNEAANLNRVPSDGSRSAATNRTADGFNYLDPVLYREYIAACLPGDEAAFGADSQVRIADANFHATIATAAWRNKPSWVTVST